MPEKSILIIGAGVAGLSAGCYARMNGYETKILEMHKRTTLIRLTLHEGRKREVKRMCAAVGHPVRALRRTALGGVHAGGLRPGEWRYLTDSEVAALRGQTGLE